MINAYIKTYRLAICVSFVLLALSVLPLDRFWEIFFTVCLVFIWASSAWRNLARSPKTQLEKQTEDPVIETINTAIDAYLEELENCLDHQVSQSKEGLEQVKNVLADAVRTMSHSFNGLNGLASEQSGTVMTLVENISESIQRQNRQCQQHKAHTNREPIGFYIGINHKLYLIMDNIFAGTLFNGKT